MHDLPFWRQFRIGNFFVPFSLEQVTNDTNNIFMERSIPTQGIFAADREVGMALYGINESQEFTWTFGGFFDSISESTKELIDDNQGYRLSGRLTWLPYYDEPSNGRYLVHTGAGILYTEDQNGLARFSARPQIHEGPRLIDSGNLAAGNYTTANLELATVWGPMSLQSEMFISSVDLDVGDPGTLYGMYVYGSYFLTGENRIYERFGQHGAQFGRNVPISNFFLVPGCHGPGAWEVKMRWSNLTLTQVDAGQYNDLTVGFNWYWTDRIRTMFDWIHPITTAQTVFGATESDIIAMRFDFNW
jgi:phosphate-selective porin OprO/OprP